MEEIFSYNILFEVLLLIEAAKYKSLHLSWIYSNSFRMSSNKFGIVTLRETVTNLSQSEASKHCFLVSDRLRPVLYSTAFSPDWILRSFLKTFYISKMYRLLYQEMIKELNISWRTELSEICRRGVSGQWNESVTNSQNQSGTNFATHFSLHSGFWWSRLINYLITTKL